MKILKPHLKDYSTAVALMKSINIQDLKRDTTYSHIFEHFSITDIPGNWNGTAVELPAATVVFDLAGSSVSIRDRGARDYVEKTQRIFSQLTSIIYENQGIIEKFPGDGISMHFPLFEDEYKNQPIERAMQAVISMHNFLIKSEQGLSQSDFRFTMTYGTGTIVTKFGNYKHEELISVGHAVNVAHKMEKLVKENGCFVGLDEECYSFCEKKFKDFKVERYILDPSMCRNPYVEDYWFGVKY